MLEKVNYPEDLRKLNLEEKKRLAQELREKMIDTVSNTGRSFSFQSWGGRTYNWVTFSLQYTN